MLGAGRNKKEDEIDYGAGIILQKKTGDFVEEGDIIAEMFTSDKEKLKPAMDKFLSSTEIRDEKPEERPLVLDVVQ